MSKDKQSDFMRGYDNGVLNTATNVYYELKKKLENCDASEKRTYKALLKELLKKYDKYIMRFGKTKPTKYEKAFCYLYTLEYRGKKVKVYTDDYGQQDYFYYKNQSYSGGAYNPNIDDYVRFIIDRDLDHICDLSDIDIRYAGAHIQYKNHEHTEILFTYRLEELKTFSNSEGEFDIDAIKQECIRLLELLFSDEEFQESERKRKESGSLYFHEMMEQEENKLEKKGN